MTGKRILGLLLILIGAGFIYFSQYIADQVEHGREEIRSGQKKINTTRSIFSQSKYTEPFGEAITRPGEKKIAAGRRDIAHYSNLASKLELAGIVLIIVGIGVFILGGKK